MKPHIEGGGRGDSCRRGLRAPLCAWLIAAVIIPADAPGAALVVISPHNEAIRHEFGRGFSEWHRARHGEKAGIDWRVIGGSSESLRFVQSEFARKPDGIGVDVFFGGGQEPYYELADRGFAEPFRLPEEILADLPESAAGIELRAPDLSWYGAAISSFGILQNLRVQRLVGLPQVASWEELARPDLLGWVGAGDPRGSGSMHVMFESFLQARGWEEGWRLLTQMAGNVRRFDRVSSTTAKDAALGETAYALAIDFYAFAQVAAAGRSNLTFVLPRDFAAISPDGIAILRGAPNRELAERFVTYVMSEDGQKLWLLPRGHPEGPVRSSIERMPVRPGLYQRYRGVSNVEASPFELRNGFRYDARLAQQRRSVVATLIGALLVDTHDSLKVAWRAVLERGAPAEDLRRLGEAPLTEDEAQRLAAGEWKDPAVRNARRIEWQIWANAKYRALVAPARDP